MAGAECWSYPLTLRAWGAGFSLRMNTATHQVRLADADRGCNTLPRRAHRLGPSASSAGGNHGSTRTKLAVFDHFLAHDPYNKKGVERASLVKDSKKRRRSGFSCCPESYCPYQSRGPTHDA